jgi:hypothetical protein
MLHKKILRLAAAARSILSSTVSDKEITGVNVDDLQDVSSAPTPPLPRTLGF